MNGWETTYYTPIVTQQLNNKSVKAACLYTDIMDRDVLQTTVPVNGKKGDVLVVGAWVDASGTFKRTELY